MRSRILNLFLSQREEIIHVAYNFTTQRVYSWEESLLKGGTYLSGSFNLGVTIHEPERFKQTIKKRLEQMNFPFMIREIDLHNGGDSINKNKLPLEEYMNLHSHLRHSYINIYSRLPVFTNL